MKHKMGFTNGIHKKNVHNLTKVNLGGNKFLDHATNMISAI